MVDGIFGVVSAIIVVGAGSILAIVQLRKTRGFDRRLEWCEEMMKALNRAGAVVSSATSADHERSEECWTEVIRCYEALIPLCGLKELYASAVAVKQIQAFMGELDRLIRLHLDTHRGDNPSNKCDGEACLDGLRRAADQLARIARGHLRLEPLPAGMASPRQRFLGSFLGYNLGSHRSAVAVTRCPCCGSPPATLSSSDASFRELARET